MADSVPVLLGSELRRVEQAGKVPLSNFHKSGVDEDDLGSEAIVTWFERHAVLPSRAGLNIATRKLAETGYVSSPGK